MIIGAIDYPITGFTNAYSSGIEWRIVAGKANPIDYGSTTAHWSAEITVEGTPAIIEGLITALEYLPDTGRGITFAEWEPVFGPEVDYSNQITCFVTSISSVVSPLNPVASLTFSVKIGAPSIVAGTLDLTVGAIQSIDRERNKAFSNQSTMSTMFGSDFLWSAPTSTVTWKARKADAIKIRKQLIQGRSQKITKVPVGDNGWLFYKGATSESFYILDIGPITCDTSAQWYILSATFGYANHSSTTVPGLVTGLVATAGTGEASVAFTTPSSDGGSPIIDYDITSYPGGIVAIGESSPIIVPGLSALTSYSFKARARNAVGYCDYSTASNTVVIPDPNSFIDSRDGEVYKTVVIGTQTWMAENFRGNFGTNYSPYNNSLNIPTLGRLYNLGSALSSAPSGWHLPTNGEIDMLINEIGGLSVAGKKLKDESWVVFPGTNDFGFTAKQTGFVDNYGAYSSATDVTHFWCDGDIVSYVYHKIYSLFDDRDSITPNYTREQYCNSVRYIKD